MAQWYKFVLYYLWIAPHALLAAVPVFMFIRRLTKNFPIFFFYALYETFVFLFLFFHRSAVTLPTGNAAYSYVFVATLAGSSALRFGIIQEIFDDVFRDYPRLKTLATASLRWLTGLLVLAAILTAVYSSGTVSDNLMAGASVLGRSVAIIQAGSLLFLFVLSRMFGLSWRRFVFGIALGFGILASTELAVWALRLTDLTVHSRQLLNLVPTGSFHVSVVVWLGYLLTVEKPVGAAAYSLPEIDQWSGELERSQ
jgi:hypothetical protein